MNIEHRTPNVESRMQNKKLEFAIWNLEFGILKNK
jgi:hypothetical protein